MASSRGDQIQGKIKKLLKERNKIVEIMYKGRYAREKCIGVPQESMLGLVGQRSSCWPMTVMNADDKVITILNIYC